MEKTSTLFQNIRRLPTDADSYVPWFAIGQKFGRRQPWPNPQLSRAVAGGLCWFCGRPNHKERSTFVLTVNGALTRESRDPPGHWGCAFYATRFWIPDGRLGWLPEGDADPRLTWLTDPDDEERGFSRAVPTVLWQTEHWTPEARRFLLGEPRRVEWFRQGMPWAGVSLDPDGYVGALAERHKLVPLIERLRPWLP